MWRRVLEQVWGGESVDPSRDAGTCYDELQTRRSLKFSLLYLLLNMVYATYYYFEFYAKGKGNVVPLVGTGIVSAFNCLALACHACRACRACRARPCGAWLPSNSSAQPVLLAIIAAVTVWCNNDVQYHMFDSWLYTGMGRRPGCSMPCSTIVRADGVCLIRGEPWCLSRSSFQSTMILLTTCSFFVLFTMRRRAAVLGTVLCVGVYAGLLLPFGKLKVDDNWDLWEFQLLGLNLAMVASAKWTMEGLHRAVFFEMHSKAQEVVHERVLRCQAEFANAQPPRASDRASSGPGSAAASEPITPSTGHAVEALHQRADDSAVMAAAGRFFCDLGEDEHWLLPTAHLGLQPGRVLGFGAHGCVVAGHLRGTPVAVKLVRSAGHAGELANELRVLRRLRHPGIVLMHGACVDPGLGVLALVLERVRGSTLRSCVRAHSEGLGLQTQRAVLLDVCGALRYLHGQTPMIVHGDLKPSNVMVEEPARAPRAKLLDFGLSRVANRRARPLGGTWGWAAPEVLALRSDRAPKASADVFSCGCLIVLVTTRREPFGGMEREAIVSMMRQSTDLRPSWPAEVALSPEGRALCEHCLSYQASERPDMAAVHEGVRRGLAPEGGRAPGPVYENWAEGLRLLSPLLGEVAGICTCFDLLSMNVIQVSSGWEEMFGRIDNLGVMLQDEPWVEVAGLVRDADRQLGRNGHRRLSMEASRIRLTLEDGRIFSAVPELELPTSDPEEAPAVFVVMLTLKSVIFEGRQPQPQPRGLTTLHEQEDREEPAAARMKDSL